MAGAEAVGSKPVWARAALVSVHCPKSIISPQSMYFLEQFQIWKEFGGGTPWESEAKVAEAILLLENAWRKENERGEKTR